VAEERLITMKITARTGSITDAQCDVLIVNLYEGLKEPGGATAAVDKALDGIITRELIQLDEFKGKLGSAGILSTYGKIPARKVIVVGLGKKENASPNNLRKAAATALKVARKLKAEKVCSILHGAQTTELNPEICARVLAEASILANYSFRKYKSEKNPLEDDTQDANNTKKDIQLLEIIEMDESKLEAINHGIADGVIIGEATNFARDLVTEQASVMTPTKMAEMAMSIGLECKVYDQKEIEQMGMNAFLAVGRGSDEPPKFIHLTYKPDTEPVKKIAVVGKGITFDSGGLDLKPPAGMLDMKMDMSGAAATLGIMKAVKNLHPRAEIHGIIPACENMPDGKSYKPGDVLTAKNGKTIEVNNTDAEGRIILADALSYAVELKPDQIIDIATLTGAIIIALGKCCAGIMSNNQEFLNNFTDKSHHSGEKVWQLPLFEEYKEFLKSDIADITNSGTREAGSSFAATFLQEFVNDIPWIHLDIAGTASSSKEKYELPKGYTGFGVRSVLYYLMDL
jgi:leucyl aminopeptidase